MQTQEEVEVPKLDTESGLSLLAYGVSIVLVTTAVSLFIWYLIGDPEISLLKLYPQPFGAFLFWGILVVVFIGFNSENWPFVNMSQPLAGVLAVVANMVITAVIALGLAYGYGSIDPTFSTLDGGTGWTAIAMIVLFGFYGYGFLSNSPGHWPWKDLGLKQPVVGIIEIFLGTVITTILYMLFMYPNLSEWTQNQNVLMALPTSVGWFYSVIVCWLTTALLWENWPWSKTPSRAWATIVAFFGNFIGGTIIYFFFQFMLKNFLVPQDGQEVLGDGINLWSAQLGVIIVSIILVWCLAFQNPPHTDRVGVKLIVRTIVVYGLGILLFLVYTRWFGTAILHEPAVTDGFGGDPLNFFDLFNLILLFYIVYFNTWPLVVRSQTLKS